MTDHAEGAPEFIHLRATAEKLVVDREIDSDDLSPERLQALS